MAASIADWAAAASAAAAAVAALAAWRAVALSWRALQPDVHGQVLANTVTGCFDISIRNSGGGLAKGVHFVLLADTDSAVGPIDDGLLGSGDRVMVHTTAPHRGRGRAQLVIHHRDADETLRAWTSEGGRKTFRSRFQRRKHYPSNDEIFASLYPNTSRRAVANYAYTVERVDA